MRRGSFPGGGDNSDDDGDNGGDDGDNGDGASMNLLHFRHHRGRGSFDGRT
jgi:hypothetical protein